MESKSSCAMQRRRAGCLPAGRYMQICRAALAGENTALAWSPLSARRARGGKSKAETKALSINPHQPRPPLAPHPRISILYFSSRQIISLSLCCYETLAAWLVAAHSAISLILALALRSAARFLRALAPCLCTHAKIEMRSSKICLCGREESGCKCLPRHKSALEKLLCVRESA
jgi:hypothetical protein